MHTSASSNTILVIYEILDMSSDAQLAPLVDTLTQTPFSTLKICRAYERHAPDHKRYVDQIGDEIYRIGQKALNIGDGSRPTYQQMIGALCKQVGLSVSENDLADNETTLLNLYTSQRLASIAVEQRQEAVNKARQAAGKGADGFFSASEWPPLAACLLQIAFLRGLHDEARHSRKHAIQPSPALSPVSDSNALVINNQNGAPVLTLAETTVMEADAGWRRIGKADTGISRLNPLLHAVPSMATAVEFGTSNYMNVIVPAGTELVNSVKQGGLIAALRKIGTNDLAGSARVDPGNLSALVTSGAVLNIASAALAQKHLADISQKLSQIKEAIEDVAAFQKNERRSILTGSIRYFEQIAGSVLSGELSDEVVHVIETHEANLLQVQDHLAMDIRSQIEALRILKDEEWVGQGKYIKALSEQQNALEKLYSEMLLCLRARACGWQLISAFPGGERRKKDRLQDIKNSVMALLPQGEAAIAIDQVLREKIAVVTSVPDRFRILRNENGLLNRISEQSTIVFDDIEKCGLELSNHDTPLSIDLKIEDGMIVATRVR